MQELDTRMDALQHQLRTIPEAARLADLGTRRNEVDGAVRDLRVQVSDFTEEQQRADADVEQVRARQARDQGMIDSGAVADPKALERMLGELDSLQRRIASLEDTELEVMERLETAQSALAERTTELDELERQAADLREVVKARAVELEGEVGQLADERKHVADGLPEDLMALYQRLREQKGGVGAAALRRRECGGCGLSINPTDLASMVKAPSDEVLRCEECSRILVRTAESGL